jgi:hypothetical protein
VAGGGAFVCGGRRCLRAEGCVRAAGECAQQIRLWQQGMCADAVCVWWGADGACVCVVCMW